MPGPPRPTPRAERRALPTIGRRCRAASGGQIPLTLRSPGLIRSGPGPEPMNSPFKPQDYSTVSPYLIVDGAQRTIEFLVAVLGAAELRRFPDAEGRLMHAEVR